MSVLGPGPVKAQNPAPVKTWRPSPIKTGPSGGNNREIMGVRKRFSKGDESTFLNTATAVRGTPFGRWNLSTVCGDIAPNGVCIAPGGAWIPQGAIGQGGAIAKQMSQPGKEW